MTIVHNTNWNNSSNMRTTRSRSGVKFDDDIKVIKMDVDEPRVTKRKRRSYTDHERELIIQADLKGGRSKRLEMARSLGMPTRTADFCVTQYRQNLKHSQTESENKKKYNPCYHLGDGPRYKNEQIQEILRMFHRNQHLEVKEIQQMVNLEILRNILIEQNVDLSEEETQRMQPIQNLENYMADPIIDARYREQSIQDENIISQWLEGLVVSKKHSFTNELDVNTVDKMEMRCRFYKALLVALNNHQARMMYIDLVPFSLSIQKPNGLKEQETQVLLGVDIENGLVDFQTYVPRRMVGDTNRVCWNNVIFRKFLDQLCGNLLKNSADSLINQNLYIIVDCPPQYLRSLKMSPRGFAGIPKLNQLKMFLTEHGGELHLFPPPPCSPCSNLAEFYNQPLRDMANKVMHDIMTDQEQRESIVLSPRSRQLQKANHTLEKVLIQSLMTMKSQPASPQALVQMIGCLKDCVYQNGYLDFAHHLK